MKSRNQKLVIAAIGAQWLSNIAAVAKALHYVCAAQRDERNRFSYTAAMEWRNAAELFQPNKIAADYCWQQWERIMRLPRRLAGPLGESVPGPAASPVPAVAPRPSVNPVAIPA
jgi:hypothetical protein